MTFNALAHYRHLRPVAAFQIASISAPKDGLVILTGHKQVQNGCTPTVKVAYAWAQKYRVVTGGWFLVREDGELGYADARAFEADYSHIPNTP